jgi:Na+-transporting methylmalonyl-CoA/oxaloacetate decarboxylase gamma subunit
MSLSVLLINWNFAISLSVIGYLIVLLALLFLFLIYSLIPKVIQFITNQYLRKKAVEGDEEYSELPVTGEVSAAISAALYLFLNEQHDVESGKITIKEVSRKYSPWSSKIYGMRQPLTK